ncbi:hypothetical protein HGM15179_007748 [Zosterops borbonicus]|uniref:Uncharacterized protein n=1 Tax=Zosterops borbonicus TaxID=364589 RepID=A0A8K1GJT9_9PASS|nr:hypothetical protein HGM15179_007748 [Zosterops borbonicus]
MEAATDSTRFGYILELLKRDKGSLLGLVLFSIFINYVDSEIQGTPSKSADGTKLSSAGDTKEGRDAIQGDLNKPENSDHETLLEFSKCKELHLELQFQM